MGNGMFIGSDIGVIGTETIDVTTVLSAVVEFPWTRRSNTTCTCESAFPFPVASAETT